MRQKKKTYITLVLASFHLLRDSHQFMTTGQIVSDALNKSNSEAEYSVLQYVFEWPLGRTAKARWKLHNVAPPLLS